MSYEVRLELCDDKEYAEDADDTDADVDDANSKTDALKIVESGVKHQTINRYLWYSKESSQCDNDFTNYFQVICYLFKDSVTLE